MMKPAAVDQHVPFDVIRMLKQQERRRQLRPGMLVVVTGGFRPGRVFRLRRLVEDWPGCPAVEVADADGHREALPLLGVRAPRCRPLAWLCHHTLHRDDLGIAPRSFRPRRGLAARLRLAARQLPGFTPS